MVREVFNVQQGFVSFRSSFYLNGVNAFMRTACMAGRSTGKQVTSEEKRLDLGRERRSTKNQIQLSV